MHELEYMKEKLLLLCIILYAIRKTNSGGRPGTRLTYTYHLLHLCIIVHVLTCMSWNTETINLSFVAMPISPTVSVKTKGHKLMNKDQNFQVYNIVFATPLGRRFISIQEKCQTWVDYISQLGLKCSLHEASWRTSMGTNVEHLSIHDQDSSIFVAFIKPAEATCMLMMLYCLTITSDTWVFMIKIVVSLWRS